MRIRIEFPSTATVADVIAAEELLRAVLARAPTVIGFSGMIGARLPADATTRLKAILPSCKVASEVSK